MTEGRRPGPSRTEKRRAYVQRLQRQAAGTRKQQAAAPPPLPAGKLARQLAVELVDGVLERHRAFDDLLAERLARDPYRDLSARDRGFARLIAATVLRRHGELTHVIASFIDKPLPADRGPLSAILLAAAAQILLLGTPAYAAVNAAVEQVRGDRRTRRFDKLTNAVLRRVAGEGPGRLARLDALALDIPGWLLERWTGTYGADTARRIGAASLTEAALDLTPRIDGAAWAGRVGGCLLDTGTVRLAAGGRIDELPGFAEGAWWVQDAAAALPAMLLGDVSGRSVLDLCGAPGGKSAQLAARGAHVTVLDVSAERLERVRANLARLGLSAELIQGDATTWLPDRPGARFDAVLLDVPCLATGTARRHPDILHLKRPEDLARLVTLQARMLDHAAGLVPPGGRLVYCTCSLEPEECGRQIEAFLVHHADFERLPVTPADVAGHGDWIDAAGDLRTFPFHSPGGAPDLPGMDGFYACRLVRKPDRAGETA